MNLRGLTLKGHGKDLTVNGHGTGLTMNGPNADPRSISLESHTTQTKRSRIRPSPPTIYGQVNAMTVYGQAGAMTVYGQAMVASLP